MAVFFKVSQSGIASFGGCRCRKIGQKKGKGGSFVKIGRTFYPIFMNTPFSFFMNCFSIPETPERSDSRLRYAQKKSDIRVATETFTKTCDPNKIRYGKGDKLQALNE